MTPSYFKAVAEQNLRAAAGHLVKEPRDAVVTALIVVMPDDRIHTKILCGKARTFEEVLDALRKCQREIEWQIKNRKKCPANIGQQ